jgi:hypothetical protein
VEFFAIFQGNRQFPLSKKVLIEGAKDFRQDALGL